MLFNMYGLQYVILLILHTLQLLKGDFSKSASGLLENSQEATISQGKQKLTTRDVPMQPKLRLKEVNPCCAAPQRYFKIETELRQTQTPGMTE